MFYLAIFILVILIMCSYAALNWVWNKLTGQHRSIFGSGGYYRTRDREYDWQEQVDNDHYILIDGQPVATDDDGNPL